MKVLLWNIRGIGEAHKQKHVHYLCQKHKPSALVIIEPKVELDSRYFCRRLGFNSVVNSNSKIWCFIKDSLHCDILNSQEQFLHLRFTSDLMPQSFLCTWVYAKHTRAERRELWDALRNIDQGVEPWLLGGDFNTVLYTSERKGGASPKIRTMEDFGDMMLDCGLQDAGFEGTQFTWSRNRLWQRLDRFIYSHIWNQEFPFTRIQHLTRNVSDHCPFSSQCIKMAEQALLRFAFRICGLNITPLRIVSALLGSNLLMAGECSSCSKSFTDLSSSKNGILKFLGTFSKTSLKLNRTSKLQSKRTMPPLKRTSSL
ncbi:UNVERIFIED_CONTAM: hypothetical protein Sradi_5523700 [Sesamum radiatum]|uniref:Endonuclease/exonuclease/phosphatase domain-containing protein n=1 Tax=Sesamum radiatum TaxID=300843 RepID=A0AAW2LAY3_SESRA